MVDNNVCLIDENILFMQMLIATRTPAYLVLQMRINSIGSYFKSCDCFNYNGSCISLNFLKLFYQDYSSNRFR